MAMKIRLARGGSKKRPHYSIVAADSRSPRDGRFIEKLGTYDPLLPKDNEGRVKIDLERAQYWLGQGAQATDRVARFLEAAGVAPKSERSNPKRGRARQGGGRACQVEGREAGSRGRGSGGACACGRGCCRAGGRIGRAWRRPVWSASAPSPAPGAFRARCG